MFLVISMTHIICCTEHQKVHYIFHILAVEIFKILNNILSLYVKRLCIKHVLHIKHVFLACVSCYFKTIVK